MSPLKVAIASAVASVAAGLVLAQVLVPEIVSIDFGLKLAVAFLPAALIILLATRRKR
jgi:hypothetical protein